jgi:cytochrome bd-type quinol oxidase subunit 2
MNVDELMSVWRSQDAAPLHGVDKTLLHLALRQDEAKLQKERRMERWITYVGSACLVACMAVFLFIMIYDDDPRTDWDFAIPVVGAAAALLWGGAMYVSHRAQALREQRFGESLRDQLDRSIAQLDYQATSVVRVANVLATALPPVVCATAIILAGWRVNNEPFRTEWVWIASTIFVCALGSVAGVWEQRRSLQRDLLPRKRRLEALLKELDDQ